MPENDEKAKHAIPEAIGPIGIKAYFPKALPLWRYCLLSLFQRERVFVLWLIFWALSVPILAEDVGSNAGMLWLGGTLFIFSGMALNSLGDGYTNWVYAVELEERQKEYREP